MIRERWKNRLTRAERLRIKYFSEEEVQSLFKAIKNPRDLLMFRLAYHHGLRASEVGMLRISDIDLRRGRIIIDRLKRSIGGPQPIHPTDLKLLREYLNSPDRVKDGDTLFVSKQRRPVSRFLLDKLMKRYAKAAKLPADKRHFHALKHSIATHLMSRGVGVKFVQDFLGHADIKNTLIYASITPDYFESQTREIFEGMR